MPGDSNEVHEKIRSVVSLRQGRSSKNCMRMNVLVREKRTDKNTGGT